MSTALLIIDPQFDFCDPSGALYVKNAENDMINLANYIYDMNRNIEGIFVTLDTHKFYDIAHNVFWRTQDGGNVAPYTVVTLNDFLEGKIAPVHALHYERCKEYLSYIEMNKKKPLVLWPPHCLLGTVGNTVYGPLYDALVDWQNKTKRNVFYKVKGLNPLSEHYSIIKNEVPLEDGNDEYNHQLIKELNVFDDVIVSGEASSHCVADSVIDILNDKNLNTDIKVLTDAMSPVPSFENNETMFLNELRKRDVSILTTKTCAIQKTLF